jgi:MFS family permease
MGILADKFSKKWVMVATYMLVAGTIPLLLLATPENPVYVYLFAILFGFGMGADYMLIPLMAAEQFGVNTLARAMAIILPADTIGQTWFPYMVSKIRASDVSYGPALNTVFVLAFIGAVAILLLPKHAFTDATVPLQESKPAPAGR